MSSFRNRRQRGRRGSLLQGLTVLTLVGMVGAFLGQMTAVYQKSAKKKIQDNRAMVATTSGIELVLFAYRTAEMVYVRAVSNGGCDNARPFLNALKLGAGCPGMPSTPVFTGSDEATADGLYVYKTGCAIDGAGSTCATGNLEVIGADIPGEVREIATEHMTKYYLTSVNVDKQVAEFAAVTATQGNRRSKFAFAIRGSLSNAAHIEADGRVTQENPDPLAKCPGSPWASFLVFRPADKKCVTFAQLGSGTGLAFYAGRYFGFRPSDGQVIDLEAATDGTSTTYLVGESGKLQSGGTDIGDAIFPPHNHAALINVDDITTVGDQIYYVADSSVSAKIAVLRKVGSAWTSETVCPLGTLGWGQAYEGIAALSRSEPLVAVTGDGLSDSRIATFFVKTSGGDLLNAVAWKDTAAGPYHCAVMKDQSLQQVEYKRTNGFDRTDSSKPYYQY